MRLWGFRAVIPADQLEAQAAELHETRGRFAGKRVLPHLQVEVEVLAHLAHAANDLAAAELSRNDTTGLQDVAANIVTRQCLLASRTLALLVTDHYTWHGLVERALAHGHGGGRLQALIKARHRTGNLKGLEIDDREVQRAAKATIQALRQIAGQEAPPGVTGEAARACAAVRRQAVKRLGLVNDIAYKRDQAEHLAAGISAAITNRLSTPSQPAGQERDGSREARRRERLEAERALARKAAELAGDVAALSRAYNITSAELRAFGWRDAARLLTRGTVTDDQRLPGYPKAQVKRVLGVLKLIKHLDTDVASTVAAIMRITAREQALRAETAALLERKELLPDQAQVIGHYARLHLSETLGWLSEHRDTIDRLLDNSGIDEAAVLASVLREASDRV